MLRSMKGERHRVRRGSHESPFGLCRRRVFDSLPFQLVCRRTPFPALAFERTPSLPPPFNRLLPCSSLCSTSSQYTETLETRGRKEDTNELAVSVRGQSPRYVRGSPTRNSFVLKRGRQRLTCCWLFGIVTEIVLVPRYNISDGMCYIHAATVCWPVASVQAKTTVPSTSVEPAALESDHALFLSPRSWSRVQTSQRRHHADGSGDLAAVGGPRRNHRHHPLHRLSLITRCPVGSMSSVPASSSVASYNFVSIV
jgi:hypothetical protein